MPRTPHSRVSLGRGDLFPFSLLKTLKPSCGLVVCVDETTHGAHITHIRKPLYYRRTNSTNSTAPASEVLLAEAEPSLSSARAKASSSSSRSIKVCSRPWRST